MHQACDYLRCQEQHPKSSPPALIEEQFELSTPEPFESHDQNISPPSNRMAEFATPPRKSPKRSSVPPLLLASLSPPPPANPILNVFDLPSDVQAMYFLNAYWDEVGTEGAEYIYHIAWKLFQETTSHGRPRMLTKQRVDSPLLKWQFESGVVRPGRSSGSLGGANSP